MRLVLKILMMAVLIKTVAVARISHADNFGEKESEALT